LRALNIEALTLYAFSVENWRRPKTETDFLMQLLREYLRQEMPLIQRNNICMRFLGRASELPAGVQQDMREAVEKTAKNTGMVLCLALNYGGRAEIVDALNEIIAQRNGDSRNRPVTEEEVARHLYTAGLPDPDLLIRSSGEMRVSNFLLWQIAYAEILVTETLWRISIASACSKPSWNFKGESGATAASAKAAQIQKFPPALPAHKSP